MEVNFFMADMRFKHDTKRDIQYGPRSYYAKVDYNALSGAVSGTINAMMDHTEKGRSIKISLDSGIIHISCAELKPDVKVRREIKEACSDLSPVADVLVDDTNGLKVTLALKDV